MAKSIAAVPLRVHTYIHSFFFIILRRKFCSTDNNSRTKQHKKEHRNVFMLVMTHVLVKHYVVRHTIERRIICMKSAFSQHPWEAFILLLTIVEEKYSIKMKIKQIDCYIKQKKKMNLPWKMYIQKIRLKKSRRLRVSRILFQFRYVLYFF